jgi:hypothetical protein
LGLFSQQDFTLKFLSWQGISLLGRAENGAEVAKNIFPGEFYYDFMNFIIDFFSKTREHFL